MSILGVRPVECCLCNKRFYMRYSLVKAQHGEQSIDASLAQN
jgi:hypothetical protein